jgi:Tol biopolymer transport system component/DNA-binding winged helix-turn-helix (wHTH) protein
MSVDSGSIESQFNINDANSGGEKVYEFEGFRLDARRLMLYHDSAELDLAPKVVETLLALVENAGRIVSKEELFDRLWKDSFVDESNLTQNVYLLRKTLGNAPDGRPLIETFRRRGYRFNGLVKGGRTAEPVSRDSFSVSKKYYFLVGGLVILLAAALVGWYAASNRNDASTPASQRVSYERLTPGSNAFSPAISSDGKYLAYCLIEPDGHSLWVKDLTGGQAKRLSPPVFKSCHHPLFSPDGKDLYLVNQESSLVRISATGGEPVEIVRGQSNPFALSPEGDRVVYVRGRGLTIAPTAGGGARILSERDGESKWYSSLSATPSWSPDGKKIVIPGGYIENGQKFAELIEVLVETGAERRVPAPRWNGINGVVWAGDGSSLFVAARERTAGPIQIWRVSYPDGNASRITNDLQSYERLTVSSDSRMLVAEKWVGASNIWIGTIDDSDSFQQLTFDEGDVTGRSGLALTKDDKVIFTAAYSGNLDIWQLDADGGRLVQLTANAGDRNIRQQVTRDGKFIVYAARCAGTTGRCIWRMNADGGGPVQLTRGGQDYPGISPDGRWVYFTNISGKASSIWKVSIDGGEISRVTGDYPAFIPSVSPDGSMLAFIYGSEDGLADSGNLAVLRLGRDEPPTRFEARPFRGISQWSPDGRSILYIQTGSPNLWRQPLDGGPPVEVTRLGLETTWNFALSPTSNKIAIARGNAATEAVLLTNLD